MELRRCLRQTESQAQAHGRLVVEQANAELLTMHRQEEEMQAQFGARGSAAQQVIFSLLNSVQGSTIRDEQGEAQVVHLEARLRYVESAATNVRGRHDDLYQQPPRSTMRR